MSGVIPQANNWDTVEKLLMLIAKSDSNQLINKEYVASYFNFNIRQSDYYAQALNFLGFVTETNSKIWPLKLNNLGLTAAQGNINGQSLYLYVLTFLNEWSAVGAIIENKEGEAIQDLMDLDNLNENTAKRRISTIKSWYKELTKRLKQQIQDSGITSEVADKIIIDNNNLLQKKQKAKIDKNNEKIANALDSIPKEIIQGEEDNSNYDKLILTKARKGHHKFTKGVKEFWNNCCAITNIEETDLLINSHIISWADSIGLEKVDPNNGLLLEPTYDKLFDRHLISFEDNGYMLISQHLSLKTRNILGLDGSQKLSKPLTEKAKHYMLHHRNKFYDKQKNQH